MDLKQKFIQTLQRYLPDDMANVVAESMIQHNFILKIAKPRDTKLGDFVPPRQGASCCKISINCDLKPCHFFAVFLHELAHLYTWKEYGKAVSPHGREWQSCYHSLLKQYLHIFPESLKSAVLDFCSQPITANTTILFDRALQNGTISTNVSLILSDLSVGDRFFLLNNPKQFFEVLEKRRTRYVCRDLNTSVQFLIRGLAEVKKL